MRLIKRAILSMDLKLRKRFIATKMRCLVVITN